jgi:hypothetical protein
MSGGFVLLLLRESEYEDGDDFAPWPTSPLYARSSSQCLLAFSQTVEGSSWLHLNPGPDYTEHKTFSSLDVCARACDEDKSCAAATFNYNTYSCWLWQPSSGGSSFAQSGGMAFKTSLSGAAAMSAVDKATMEASAAGNSSIHKQQQAEANAGAVTEGSFHAKSTGKFG